MADLFTPQEIIPNEKIWYLISKDTKGKIRIAIINYELINPDDAQTRYFVIHRISGQLGGKRTIQPDKIVERGKSVRNLWEQVMLEAKHLVKEKLDKGYKEIEKDPDEYSVSELESILGTVITGQNGIPKPQLAKQADKVTNPKVFDKEYYASRKIDGLRALIYMGDDGKLHTQSRGAMNYDAAMSDILEHPKLIELFKEREGLILDGECFKLGLSLQKINSIARTQKTAVDYTILQYYMYDIVDLNSTFEERLSEMKDIADELNLSFDPEREFEEGELRIQFVPQVPVSGWDNIKKLHDEYVAEGWEGVVIRLSDSPYKPNSRTNNMLKVKSYQDTEIKVIGYELGLRGTEDMTFRCVLEDGTEFLAKPHGDRSIKEEYVKNFDSYYNGRYATIKYFYLSDTGVPLQPSLAYFKIDEDLG